MGGGVPEYFVPLSPPFLTAKISRQCSKFLFVRGPSLCPIQKTNAELDLSEYENNHCDKEDKRKCSV